MSVSAYGAFSYSLPLGLGSLFESSLLKTAEETNQFCKLLSLCCFIFFNCLLFLHGYPFDVCGVVLEPRLFSARLALVFLKYIGNLNEIVDKVLTCFD